MAQQGEDVTASTHVPADSQGEDVYCTLLMSDDYLPGAQVLAHSLKDAGTKKKLAVLVTLDSLSASTIAELDKLYDYIIPVERIVNRTPANLYLMNRGDLTSTFTKINLWRQRRFRKIVYLDADVVALRAPDELFDIKDPFAAAPDVGWPDCFNSGVLVLNPDMAEYYSLLALAQRGVSFDGADQGLLNMHFRNFHRISFRYNCTPSSHYQYVPAYRHFQSGIALLHFIGKDKPWFMGRDAPVSGGAYNELLGRWWAVHDRHLRGPTVELSTDREGMSLLPDSSKIEAPLHEETMSAVASRPTEPGATLIKPPRRDPFIAPQSDWDPAKSAPPVNSRPEAVNFPQTRYKMSQDHGLFKPPSSYPEAPKDLSYEVPKPTPTQEPLKPIFPWELNAPKPTRVFAEDYLPSPSKTITPPLDDVTPADDVSLATPPAQVASPVPWEKYSVTNAWDEIPEITQFISMMTLQRKGRLQVLDDEDDEDVASPVRRKNKPSMKLTDFPTEIERPSLPVTPAPVKRPTFWGLERDMEGELPAAEGVPNQDKWDPAAKLEELSQMRSKFLPEIVRYGVSKETRKISPGESASHPPDPVSSPSGMASSVEEKPELQTGETAPLSGDIGFAEEQGSRSPKVDGGLRLSPTPLPLLDPAVTFAS
ncbi:MAG: glycogenin glucosyltransferase [Peltula sp. TS41687]|nr:MAG: glycogenin glucosyltransferase [Peltula sp. TS41687]